MTVYIDMDGVLADFDKGLLENYGIKNCIKNYGTDWDKKTEEQKAVATAVREKMALPEFWNNLPVMEGAVDLWYSVKDPMILTAVPGQGHDEMVIQAKKNWVENVLGPYASQRLITCLRPDKIKYATRMEHGSSFPIENILIDDLPKNCQEWSDAGGYAILFENSRQAINDLKKAQLYLYGEKIA